MSDIYVDTEALAELRKRLVDISVALEHAKDDVNAYDSELGSKKIDHALNDFISGWKDGRKKILKSINGMIGRIDSAIEAYEKVEQSVVTTANETAAQIGSSDVSVSG
jgi:archaellum component FlaC